MCFLVNCALRLFSDVERRLKSGFNKIEEGGHELAKTVSTAVPQLLGSNVRHVS
jgi:hypothetical protein